MVAVALVAVTSAIAVAERPANESPDRSFTNYVMPDFIGPICVFPVWRPIGPIHVRVQFVTELYESADAF